MPEFNTEIDIDPSEFIDSCSKRELTRLVEILEEEEKTPSYVKGKKK